MSIIVLRPIIFGVIAIASMIISFNFAAGRDSRGGLSRIGLIGTELKEWGIAIVTGLAIGGLYGVALNATKVWLAWLALAGVIMLCIALSLFWRKAISRFRETIPCIAMITMLHFIARASARIITAKMESSPTMSKIVGVVPIILAVIMLAFLAVTLAKRCDKAREGQLRRLPWVIRAIALVLIVVLLIMAFASCDAADTSGGIAGLTVRKLTPEELEELSLTKFKGVPETLLDSSLSPRDKERTSRTGFSDALTFGFENNKDSATMFEELEAEVLRNPVYGVTVANAIKDKKIGNRKIGDLNPWMAEMVDKNSAGVVTWCEYRNNDTKVIYVTKEYRCYGATLCIFLERLVEQGVQKHKTVENWCLNCSTVNNDRTGIKADYQYKKDALILSYVGKNGSGLFIIGFNAHDKRPEFFGEEDLPELKKKSSSTTITEPDQPGSSDSESYSPPLPSQYSKDPADDPVNNGNANKGGGNNKPGDGAGEYQSSDPRKQDPGLSSTPATPAPTPGHSSEELVDDENKMNYEPDPVTSRGPVENTSPTGEDGDGEFAPSD